MHKIIADFLCAMHPEAAVFLITAWSHYILSPCSLWKTYTNSREGMRRCWLYYIKGGECVLRARDFERMKSAMRERLRTESVLCARVCRGWSEGLKYKGLGETARSFRWCQGCPQGNRRFLPSQLGARIIREFLEKEGSWWAIAVIKRPL